MQLGYTIIYVSNVEDTINFYQKAFKLKLKFLHESKQYGELDTGATTLAFADNLLIEANGIDFVKNNINNLAAGFEIAFTTDNVKQDYTYAISNGAISVAKPLIKPWGQEVAYVRDINGILIEICSLIS